MLAKANPQQLIASPPRESVYRDPGVKTRQDWMPGLLFESLPYFYLTAGFAAFFTTLYITDWFWILPHYLLGSTALLHVIYSVYRARGHKPAIAAVD